MLTHPEIDPIAFSVGPLAVRWYGLMYLAGFAAAWWLGGQRIRKGLAPITREQFEGLMFWAVLGVILCLAAFALVYLLPGFRGKIARGPAPR